MIRLNLRSSWWVAGAVLFGAAFILSSSVLMVQVSGQQEQVRRNVSVISALTHLENLVEELSDTVSRGGQAAMVQSQLTDGCRKLMADERCRGPLQQVLRYSSGMDSLSHLLANDKSDAGRILLLQKAEDTEGDLRLEIRKAIGKIRAEQGEISASLANKWLGLHVLLITACVMMLPLFLLLIVTQRNIRRRMMTEQEARDTNTLLDAILANIPDMIFVKDAKNLKLVRVNKAAEELMGLTQQELLGKSNHELFPGEIADELTKHARSVLGSGATQDIAEEKLHTPKGERWMRTRKVPLLFDNGTPRFLVTIYEDISAQKQIIDSIKAFNEQLEKKVQERTMELEKINRDLITNINERIRAEELNSESEHKYKMLLDTVGEGVMYADNYGKILFVNKRFCEMVGYSEKELIGQVPLFLLSGEEDIQKINEQTNERKKDSTSSYEMRLRKKSGELIHVFITGVPVKSKDGAIIGSLGTHLDVTAMRLTEKKLLEKISELDMFFYRSSHDLKGPLASMQGLLKLALRDVQDPAALNYLEMLRQTSDKLDHILLGLLEVLRITRGEDKAEPVDVESLVREVLTGFDHLSGRNEVKIEEEILVRHPLFCNRAALRSVIQNLVHNAIMYRKPGNASSWVRIVAVENANEIIIEISDNGVGIPDALQEKVFDIFFRAHSSSQGSGLGLYIVKNALEKMQGTISIKSISGKGSTFTIRLPYNVG